jgi:hypothetical protein
MHSPWQHAPTHFWPRPPKVPRLQLTAWPVVVWQSLEEWQFCSDGHARPHALPLAAGPLHIGELYPLPGSLS